MKTLLRGTIGAVAVLLAAGLSAGDAAAKKPQLSARIHGRMLRAHGARVQLVTGPTVFGIVASAGSVRSLRAIAVACVAFDLAHTPLPTTLTQCTSGDYEERRLAHRHLSDRVWPTPVNFQVTIDAFDGARARGTFSGTFDGSPSGDLAVTVQNGKFDAATITGGG